MFKSVVVLTFTLKYRYRDCVTLTELETNNAHFLEK